MVLVLGISASVAKELVPDPPLACEPCAEWNKPLEPFQIFGNTWYVGTGGLSSILVTSDKGHILIDGGLPQSAALIAANIRKAGFKLEDVKLILNSHTHYDHAGGIAALQRASGAKVAASPLAAAALEQGGPTEDDPQFTFGHAHNDYAPVHGGSRDPGWRDAASRHARGDGALHAGSHTRRHELDLEFLRQGPLRRRRVCGQPEFGVRAAIPLLRRCQARRGVREIHRHGCRSRAAVFRSRRTRSCSTGMPSSPGAAPRRRTRSSSPTRCRTYAEGARQRLEKRLAEERAQK